MRKICLFFASAFFIVLKYIMYIYNYVYILSMPMQLEDVEGEEEEEVSRFSLYWYGVLQKGILFNGPW